MAISGMTMQISIHAPARGATSQGWIESLSRKISIHAPARGATNVSFSCHGIVGISIHAPARGATERILNQCKQNHKNFNPRSREGSDFSAMLRRSFWKISIHAPARGATLCGGVAAEPPGIFQSTLPRGERR